MDVGLNAIVDIPLEQQIPGTSVFLHDSALHGQLHVARVMIHASLLVRLCCMEKDKTRLWAAVYLHDIARLHDGVCYEHGERAMERFRESEEMQGHLATGGIRPVDYDAITTAVVHHCKPNELRADHIDYPLTALLKDADGLDRVRLGDLNPKYLRHEISRELIPFAETLYKETDYLQAGDSCFPEVWSIAQELWAELGVDI